MSDRLRCSTIFVLVMLSLPIVLAALAGGGMFIGLDELLLWWGLLIVGLVVIWRLTQRHGTRPTSGAAQ